MDVVGRIRTLVMRVLKEIDKETGFPCMEQTLHDPDGNLDCRFIELSYGNMRAIEQFVVELAEGLTSVGLHPAASEGLKVVKARNIWFKRGQGHYRERFQIDSAPEVSSES